MENRLFLKSQASLEQDAFEFVFVEVPANNVTDLVEFAFNGWDIDK